MSRSMKSSKSEDISIRKILPQTTTTLVDSPLISTLSPSPCPALPPTANIPPNRKIPPLLQRYHALQRNLQAYRLRVDEHMSHEAFKNHAFYLELMKAIEKNQIKT